MSCWSANGCLAVGSTGSAAGAGIDTLKGLADSWNGRTWKNIHAATPPHGTGSTHGWRNGWELPAVSCATATDCVAFGVAGTLGSFRYLFPFAEFYAGSRLVSVSDS